MKRRDVLAAAGTVATAGLAGCTGSGGVDDDPAAANGTGTPSDRPGSSRVVTVSGTGEVTGDPDRAVLELDVEARGDSAGTVRDELAGRAEAVRAAVVEAGVDEEDITTSRFRIHERIDRRRLEEAGVDPRSPEARERFRFYEGTYSFRVEIDDIDGTGTVIDAAVDAGVDQVDRVLFTLSDEKRAELREEALRRAIRNARAEANTIAEEVDGEIIEATVVDASRGRIRPIERQADALAVATAAPTETPGGASTGVEPGDVTVSVEVDVRYSMA
jgi:uncharacterized protein YggE